MNLKKGNLYKDDLGFFIIVDVCTKNKRLNYKHCKHCGNNGIYPKPAFFKENETVYLIYSFYKDISYFWCDSEQNLLTLDLITNENNES
ncbi:hypothetical protein M0R19_03835 [Candidatus Pacearchaeota archaeon]|nr:hypothetical protein [Candidatus Pacearchaeota archaeon]